MWGSPLKPPKPPKQTAEKPKKPEKPPPTFKPEKLSLTKAEAKKVLYHSGELSVGQIAWVQRWLEQKVRERSLPPQLAKGDAHAQILAFLEPSDASALLEDIRRDFGMTLYDLPPPRDDDFGFLLGLAECVAYPEHLPPPQTSSRNSRRQDDDPESD
jgi:hypothetical protein